jgi:hypothetical protein
MSRTETGEFSQQQEPAAAAVALKAQLTHMKMAN